MTLGHLRTTFLLIWMALFVPSLVMMSGGSRLGSSLVGTLMASFVLLLVPTIKTGRIQYATPLRLLGGDFVCWCVVVFVLGMLAPAAFFLSPWLGGAALAALIGSYVRYHRVAEAAIAQHHHRLRESGGDADFGVFTALTPMSPPPRSDPSTSGSNTGSLYDPSAVRDPMDTLRPKRKEP